MTMHTPFIAKMVALALLLLSLSAESARGMVLVEDTLWQGEVRMEEDVLVAPGVTLTIAAGTRIVVQPADNTKIDPEYLSHQTELLIRGRLLVNGTDAGRVSFRAEGGPAPSL